MKRIHIVGRKNHGKTTLIVELIEQLTHRGLRVGAIKHTRHAHELDVPGKDSHRQRAAGADPVAVVTKDTVGLYIARPPDDRFYDLLAPLFCGCDLVLVEGHVDSDAIKIEVWRAAAGGKCLASERSDIKALVTDDEPRIGIPIWPRGDVLRLVDRIISLF